MKFPTVRFSALRVGGIFSFSMAGVWFFREVRIIFRRWLKAVAVKCSMVLKSGFWVSGFGVKRTTAELTLSLIHI